MNKFSALMASRRGLFRGSARWVLVWLNLWGGFLGGFKAESNIVTAAESTPVEHPAEKFLGANLSWERLPDLPDELGVAGPFVGTHGETLIVAGGAHFPQPVWETDKVWQQTVYVLSKSATGLSWKEAGQLPRSLGYGAAVSIPDGVVCMGGNNAEQTFADVFLLQWNPKTETLQTEEFPSLPQPCAYGQAVLVGQTIYLAGGQSGSGLETALKNFWALDLTQRGKDQFVWQELSAWPGPARSLNLTVAQHNGYYDCVYVLSGRHLNEGQVEFLTDLWEYTPATGEWRQRQNAPRCVMAGTAVPMGQSHVYVLSGDDGSLFTQADQLREEHPGFIREALSYHTITDRWSSLGELPQNQVTTIPVTWRGHTVLASGEIRPRVRTAAVWQIEPISTQSRFGVIDYSVLFCYLLAMVGVGVYFTYKNKNTDDYFRGGKQIPWWAAGCSIFATMLSSLTFTGIPSKAFAQDWVYAIGNFMIPLVAFVGVYVALPFYRRIDATSAYEYLELRFHRSVRLFGSASFTLFHIFRMAVVMSLTGLALAVATPLTPAQSVLLMGVLSIIYCTLGGIEAVIWTDTIQTVVLLGGAVLALGLLIAGTDGGWNGMMTTALAADKFRLAHFHWSVSEAQLALWVVVIGAIGQNISSYTADQAVVQRYMTTSTQQLAARSIWTNALLTIPATLLFFGIGTALYAYYQSHPERLDATITTDQLFPYFIAHELPVGIAGLIVAGIFSAAQSTVSTSMNSTATTLVTDFLRPLQWIRTEQSYFRAAQFLTFLLGVLGTWLALTFISPEIRSLFDSFIKVIGLFMGVLGGLFALGVLTKRANAGGAMTGAVVGSAVMFFLWQQTNVNGYLYTTCGIVSCFVSGYLASFLWKNSTKNIDGLTLYTLSSATAADQQASPKEPVDQD